MSRHTIGKRFRETATLIRHEPGAYNEYGEWVSGAEVPMEVTVVSAPTDAATVRNVLPEGVRLQDARRFWLPDHPQPVRLGAEASSGDILQYAGVRYRVHHAEDWRPHGFVEVLAIREEGQSGHL